MAQIGLSPDDVRRGDFPAVCLECGKEAVCLVRHDFAERCERMETAGDRAVDAAVFNVARFVGFLAGGAHGHFFPILGAPFESRKRYQFRPIPTEIPVCMAHAGYRRRLPSLFLFGAISCFAGLNILVWTPPVVVKWFPFIFLAAVGLILIGPVYWPFWFVSTVLSRTTQNSTRLRLVERQGFDLILAGVSSRAAQAVADYVRRAEPSRVGGLRPTSRSPLPVVPRGPGPRPAIRWHRFNFLVLLIVASWVGMYLRLSQPHADQFRFEPPGPGWRHLSPDELSKEGYDARVGFEIEGVRVVIRSTSTWSASEAVLEGRELEIANMHLKKASLVDGLVSDVTVDRLWGFPSVQFRITGTSLPPRPQPVRIVTRVVAVQNSVYTVSAVGRDTFRDPADALGVAIESWHPSFRGSEAAATGDVPGSSSKARMSTARASTGRASTAEALPRRAADAEPPIDLAGKTAAGTIGDWKVRFAFATDGTSRIFDAKDNSQVGNGRWQLDGRTLRFNTSVSTFEGVFENGTFAGTRTKREDDGRVNTDRWAFTLPAGGGR